MNYWAKHFRTPFLHLDHFEFDKAIVKEIPEETARAHKVIALEKYVGKTLGILTVASSNPKCPTMKSVLEKMTGCIVQIFE